MLETYIKKRREKKSLLLMAHLVIGYPSLEDNRIMLEKMAEADVDIVELQFPFSEPVADGPLFVQANQAALDSGITVDQCLEFMKESSEKYDFPCLMMGYYNTVFVRGEETFCKELKECGAKGYIVPDAPIAKDESLYKHAKAYSLDPILIITPNTSLERKKEIASCSEGFVYCVARKGVTGQKTDFGETLKAYLSEVKKATHLPIALGFGVKSKEDFDALRGVADIAVLGTEALRRYKEDGIEKYLELLKFHLD